MISIKLQGNFIGITLRHGCSPLNFLRAFIHIFLRTPLECCFWLYQFLRSSEYFRLSSTIPQWCRYFGATQIADRWDIWDKLFKNGPSKICGRQPLKIWRDMACLSRPYLFKFFKGCLPKILFGPFLNLCSIWYQY